MMYEKDARGGSEELEDMRRDMEQLKDMLRSIMDSNGADRKEEPESDEYGPEKYISEGMPPQEVAGTEYEDWWRTGFSRIELELMSGRKWRIRGFIERADTASIAREFTANTPPGDIILSLLKSLSLQPPAEPQQKHDPNSQNDSLMRVSQVEEDRYFGRRP